MSSNTKIECFFLEGKLGRLFSIYYSVRNSNSLGSILYFHPFAEEMNKSRRMAAIQARSFLESGYNVLMIDLYGCGDSEGDFEDADWDIWIEDSNLAMNWLKNKCDSPIYFWGMRLGALLALRVADLLTEKIDKIILWQPVLNGSGMLTEFLRISVAEQMLNKSTNTITTSTLKAKLFSGETIELSGYRLSANLAKSIDEAHAKTFSRNNSSIIWIDVVRNSTNPISPVITKVLEEWERKHIKFTYERVIGESFWNSGEIIECPGLIQKTCSLLEKV